MMRKIIHIVIWVLIISWFTVMMGFVAKSNSGMLCRELRVNISDSATTRFVTDQAVREMIMNSGMNIQGYPVEEIDTRKLEHLIEQEPYVANAEVYTDIEGTLFVDIDQRKPMVRIMPDGKRGYYVDAGGVVLPLSDHYAPMVLLVTGYCDFPVPGNENDPTMTDPAGAQELDLLLSFAAFIEAHPFWSNQIVQLYRGRDGDYELIPRVGAHQIEFGGLAGYPEKLRNLKLLYEQGLKQYGWNTYDKINLKYSNQIICTKR